MGFKGKKSPDASDGHMMKMFIYNDDDRQSNLRTFPFKTSFKIKTKLNTITKLRYQATTSS